MAVTIRNEIVRRSNRPKQWPRCGHFQRSTTNRSRCQS